MPSYFLWIMLIGMLLMMWFVSRRQRAMQEEQRRRTEKGLVVRTPRGRAATPAAYSHLGLEPPAEGSLFS